MNATTASSAQIHDSTRRFKNPAQAESNEDLTATLHGDGPAILGPHYGMVDGHVSDTTNPNRVWRKADPPERLVYENHVSIDGEPLTTVEPNESYDDALRHNIESAPKEKVRKAKRQDPRSPELSSGPRAGVAWERSAYVSSSPMGAAGIKLLILSSIRWAPLNVPLHRRLQTLVLLWHTVTIPVLTTFFLVLCAIPITWPLVVPYLIFTLVYSDAAISGTLSRRSALLRRSRVWSLFAAYFPARLHRTVKLEPTRKYIFGYHPHGIIGHGAFSAFATEALGFSDLYPGITNSLLTLDSNFRLPIYRDYALALGLASVSKESIENILSKGGHDGAGMGRAVTIIVGGAQESLDAKPHSLRLVLNSRKGFVKMAIRTGADLVPVLAFGENDLYDQIDTHQHARIYRLQMSFKRILGFTVPLFHARGVFNYDIGLIPYRQAINIVIGKPIKVIQQGGKDGKVDESYLDAMHAAYVDELKRLWENYKDTFAKERQDEMEIIE